MAFFPALAPADYTTLTQTITLDSDTTSVQVMISINDDDLCESDEGFEITLTSLNDNCAVINSSVPVLIIDNDGEYCLHNTAMVMTFMFLYNIVSYSSCGG